MNILYTCDDNYIWLMGISVISLLKNNRHIAKIDIYVLGEKISTENKKLLELISRKYARSINVIDVPDLDIPDTLVSARWPISAFTRLYAGQLLPNNLEHVLYLDCDTIIRGDISELDCPDMNECIFCGVKDCIAGRYKKNIGLSPKDVYINAGVLSINLKRLKELNINQLLDNYMLRYGKLINYADQDILNGVFHNHIGILDARFNVMTIDVTHTYNEICILRNPTNFYSRQELICAVNNPTIVHYTTNMRVIRPWFSNSNHPLKDDFFEYFSESPWNYQELEVFRFTSIEAHVIGIIQVLPPKMALPILGIIHSIIKPLVIKLRANK